MVVLSLVQREQHRMQLNAPLGFVTAFFIFFFLSRSRGEKRKWEIFIHVGRGSERKFKPSRKLIGTCICVGIASVVSRDCASKPTILS